MFQLAGLVLRVGRDGLAVWTGFLANLGGCVNFIVKAVVGRDGHDVGPLDAAAAADRPGDDDVLEVLRAAGRCLFRGCAAVAGCCAWPSPNDWLPVSWGRSCWCAGDVDRGARVGRLQRGTNRPSGLRRHRGPRHGR